MTPSPRAKTVPQKPQPGSSLACYVAEERGKESQALLQRCSDLHLCEVSVGS